MASIHQLTKVCQLSFHKHKLCCLCIIASCEKNGKIIKILLASYPHFLKNLFKSIKRGLSYTFKRDPRLFSEFIQVWTISIIDSLQNGFWRLSLIDWKFNIDWRWNCPQLNFQSISDKNGPNLCKFWKWPRITFEAVAEATLG